MGLFNWKTKDITPSELGEAQAVATQSLSGTFNQTSGQGINSILGIGQAPIPFESIVDGNVSLLQSRSLLWNLINIFQDFYLSQYTYTGVEDFDFQYMESRLYWQGAAVVFKMYDKNKGKECYYSLPFVTEVYDELMFPLKVKPLWPNKNIKGKTLTVGKDCVLALANFNSFISANLWMFGKLYQMWDRFQELNEIYTEIKNNTRLTRERLLIPTTTSGDEMFNSILQQFSSGSPLLRIDPNSMSNMVLQGMAEKGMSGILPFKDRSIELWGNFLNTWNLIKEIAYVNHNGAQEKKERLITDEVNSNNTLVQSGLNNAFMFRERFVEQFNNVFGTNLKVEISPDAMSIEDVKIGTEKEEKTTDEY